MVPPSTHRKKRTRSDNEGPRPWEKPEGFVLGAAEVIWGFKQQSDIIKSASLEEASVLWPICWRLWILVQPPWRCIRQEAFTLEGPMASDTEVPQGVDSIVTGTHVGNQHCVCKRLDASQTTVRKGAANYTMAHLCIGVLRSFTKEWATSLHRLVGWWMFNCQLSGGRNSPDV